MGTASGDGIELMSERLRLRLPTEHDAEFVQDMYSREEVTQFIGATGI